MISYYNRLPLYVRINGKKFIINSDYRIFINFEIEMQGENKEKAIMKALRKFYPAFSVVLRENLLEEAVNKFIWFYHCGIIEDYKTGRTTKNQAKITQIFNYEYDKQLICGAYLMYAHIDLHKYLHWWQFKEIWDMLPDECEFVKIKAYRAYNGDDKDLLEKKEYYKLPPTEAEIKEKIKADRIFEALK